MWISAVHQFILGPCNLVRLFSSAWLSHLGLPCFIAPFLFLDLALVGLSDLMVLQRQLCLPLPLSLELDLEVVLDLFFFLLLLLQVVSDELVDTIALLGIQSLRKSALHHRPTHRVVEHLLEARGASVEDGVSRLTELAVLEVDQVCLATVCRSV